MRSYSSNIPFVVYRKPNEELVSAYIQNTQKLYELKSFYESGFVFAPFNKNKTKIIFPINKCEAFTTLINVKTKLKIDTITTSFLESSKIQLKNDYIELVQKAVDFIRMGKAKKIVLSRKEILNYPEFDVINTFKKMLESYKNTFVYAWYHPVIGLWMGASPERLINIHQKVIKTMALAGTQIYDGITNVVWKKKEKQEQQFVTDYILNTIKNYVDIVETTEPYTIKVGNLLHIRTDISGKLKSTNLIKNLINSLHPTPAICGLPKSIARDFILQNEAYNRVFYTGYLGELNMENTTNLFVNLRCMQVENDNVSIYIGGGITTDSNPKKEWNETVSKAEVMKKVLR